MAIADTALDPLRADPRRGAILCDIDGTLAPIVDDPDRVAVPSSTRSVLSSLARRYALVACVTGRRAVHARSIVGLEELTYAGNHGLELLRSGEEEPAMDPALGDRGAAAAGFVSRLDRDGLGAVGLRLEDKGPIQVLHWRGAADENAAAGRASEVAELAAKDGLVPHFGRRVLELRPTARVDKGVVTGRLVEEAGVAVALFGGDDRTDLDAFAAMRELERRGAIEHAICVGVRSEEGPEEITREADVIVDECDGFAELLRTL